MYQVVNYYKFVGLPEYEALGEEHKAFAKSCNLSGSLLYAPEGVNCALAGLSEDIEKFYQYLTLDVRFKGVEFKKAPCERVPFKRLVLKTKDTIIRFNDEVPLTIEEIENGKRISPAELHDIIKNRPEEAILIDTRNWYETDYGTFEGAKILPIKKFTEFCDQFTNEFGDKKDAKFVFFCTGGIRCEKAAPWAEKAGFKNVYQLEGGILNYFKEFGSDGYQGNCFVFDQRWTVDGALSESDGGDTHNMRIQPKPLRV